jgi:hypothetical protein
MQDPCTIIHEINFNNEEDLKKVLVRDKHTRIEGLFTEVFFFEEILKNNFQEVSTGWWFCLKNQQYYLSKLILSVNDLTAVDLELLEHFSSRNHNVFIVEFCEAEKNFYYGKFEKGTGEKIKQQWNTIKRLYSKNKKNSSIPLENERNPSRLKQAMEYLNKHGVLKKCAIERLFANCWLADALYWDIDFFIKYKNKFIAFEVKQKFPTAKGTWGLNVGLAKLFQYLNTVEIEIIHVILKKPVNDNKIPAIDLYMVEKYKKNAKWIATKFSDSFLNGIPSVAPSYTSIFGSAPLSYYNLSQELFTVIKEVASDTNNILDFLERVIQ